MLNIKSLQYSHHFFTLKLLLIHLWSISFVIVFETSTLKSQPADIRFFVSVLLRSRRVREANMLVLLGAGAAAVLLFGVNKFWADLDFLSLVSFFVTFTLFSSSSSSLKKTLQKTTCKKFTESLSHFSICETLFGTFDLHRY